jgi:hypothetical protein
MLKYIREHWMITSIPASILFLAWVTLVIAFLALIDAM